MTIFSPADGEALVTYAARLLDQDEKRTATISLSNGTVFTSVRFLHVGDVLVCHNPATPHVLRICRGWEVTAVSIPLVEVEV